MSNSPSTFTKENLNFQLPAQQRACFYEDIDLKLPTRTVEVFVHSISDMQVQLAIYGPLEYKKLIDVCLLLDPLSIVPSSNCVLQCMSIGKIRGPHQDRNHHRSERKRERNTDLHVGVSSPGCGYICLLFGQSCRTFLPETSRGKYSIFSSRSVSTALITEAVVHIDFD